MITSIRLQNFRSYGDSAFEFESGTNIIVGPNASGKTNLLEAVYYICSMGAFRASDHQNIKIGETWSRIDATTNNNQQRTLKLSEENGRSKKDFEIDGVLIKSPKVNDIMPAVLFEPNQLYELVTSPEERRNFIDNLACQIYPENAIILRDYKRTLSQRNRLLKQGYKDVAQTIFAWDIRLSELAQQVVDKRIRVINELNKTLTQNYTRIAGGNNSLITSYESKIASNASYGTNMLNVLKMDIEKDIARGFSSVGPHRDDLSIILEGNELRGFASRGETRTAILALKKCETTLLEQKTNKKPILLFDDVFSELDGKRRKLLTGFLSDYQTLITTTDADIIDKSYAQKTQLIKLK
jgi:DNA replication and repair protein RecF